VFAAGTDRNQLIALDAASGKELWRATVGGRLDSPPTIHEGLCLIGSHDGYVYAFTCDKGQLAWRLRVAPREERMVSSGKVESPWPVIGTVLVADGTAFVSAGNTQGSDGGIVVRAFEPLTGKVRWSKAIVMTTQAGEYRAMRRNDLLLKTGNSIQLMTTRLDPKTGEFVKNPTLEYQKFQDRQRRLAVVAKKTSTEPKKLEETPAPDEIAPGIGLEGFIAATWTQLGDRKYKAMTLGNVSAPQLSWGDDLVCGNPSDGKAICAINRDKVAPFGSKTDAKARRWQQNLPENYQATSVVTAPNAVVVGGGVYRPGETGGGFMRVLSTDKGETLAEQFTGSPLVYNSVAVAGGKVYATLADGSVLCLGKR
jgi:outer membrane protein assembly factor BamB